MAIDSSDVLHVTWSEEVSGSYDVIYRNFNGVSWSGTTNLSNNYGSSYQSDIVVVSDGTMLVAWQDTTNWNFHPMYSYYNGTTWSPAADIAIENARQLNVEYQGGVFYAAWDHGYSSGKRTIRLATFDGTSWTVPITLGTPDSVNWLSSTGGGLAVDVEGGVHLTYSENIGKLWYTVRK